MILKLRKNSFKSKQRARRFAMQALYQWHSMEQDFSTIKQEFLSQEEMVSVDTDYFQSLVQGVIDHVEFLDTQLKELIDRPLKQLDFVELAILRLGAYELIEQPHVPYKVVLNEGIELAKEFGATDSYKYINGTLHRLAKQTRISEFETSQTNGLL